MLHIQLDDATAEVVREQAKQAGKTLEAWVADVVQQQAAPADDETGQLRRNTREWVKDLLAATEHPKGNSGGDKEWIKKFLENADQVRGHSGGWKWNREELYDR